MSKINLFLISYGIDVSKRNAFGFLALDLANKTIFYYADKSQIAVVLNV